MHRQTKHEILHHVLVLRLTPLLAFIRDLLAVRFTLLSQGGT